MSLITNIGKNSAILKKFIRYLKDNGIYSSYFSHLHSNRNLSIFNTIYSRCEKRFFSECPPHNWLTECFCWVDQKEGHQFWEKFHDEWNHMTYKPFYEV